MTQRQLPGGPLIEDGEGPLQAQVPGGPLLDFSTAGETEADTITTAGRYLPQRWRQQPQGQVGMREDHFAASALHGGFISPGVSVARTPHAADHGGFYRSASAGSLAWRSDSTTSPLSYFYDASPGLGELTVIVRAVRLGDQLDSGFGKAVALRMVAGTQDGFHLFLKSSAAAGGVGERLRINTTASDNNDTVETTADWVVGQMMTGLYTWRSGQALEVYRDGRKLTPTYSTETAVSGVLKSADALQFGSATLRLNGAIATVLVFGRYFPEAAAIEASREPYAILTRPRRPIIFSLPSRFQYARPSGLTDNTGWSR